MRATGTLLLTLCAALPLAHAAQTIIEYPIPTPNSFPTGITAGPDGNVWFTENGCSTINGVCLSKIGKITPAGVITEYTIPTPASYPAGITSGPDGNLWFCEQQGSKIGRITTSGVITEFPVPTSGSQPYGITAGPDGNLWFAEFFSGTVGKITPAGVIAEYTTNSIYVYSITAGPDGKLWIGSNDGTLSAVTTAGVVSNIYSPYWGNQGVIGIATGPDGKIWYTSPDQTIDRFNPNPLQFAGRSALNQGQQGQLGMITRGPSNDLWFTVNIPDSGHPLVGQVTTAGVVTEFPLSNADARPWGIATGPDGNVWFTECGGNAIGVVVVSSIAPPAGVTVSQSALTFSGVAGGAAAPSQTVSITSSSATPFTATATVTTPYGTNWLKISPSGNLTTNQTITVIADPSGITNTGTYTGTIAVVSGTVTQTVNVTFNISAPTTGNVKTDYSSLAFAYTIGGTPPSPQQMYLTSVVVPTYSSQYQIPFTATTSVSSPSGGKWLSLSSGSQGTTPATISVAVNPAGLAPGTYNGTVTISPTGGSPLIVPVTLTVTGTAVLMVNPTSLNLSYTYGDSTVYSPSVQVSEQSGLNVGFTAAVTGGPSWISLSAGSFTTPRYLPLFISPGGVAPGVYSAKITISAASGATVTVPISITIQHPPLMLSASKLTFGFAAGGTAPAAQSVQVSSSAGASAFTVTDLYGYLSVSPSSGTTPATLSVSLSAAGQRLSPGSVSDMLIIDQSTPGDINASIQVTINVSNAGSLAASPASLTASYAVGGSAPPAQTIQLTAAGSNSAVPFTASTAGTSWLTVSPTSGTTPSALSVSIAPAGLNPGVYTGTIYINSTGAVSPLAIYVTLTVSAAPSVSAGPASLSFTAAGTQAVQVTATGGAAVSFTATANSAGGWLSVTPTSGSTPATLQVSVAFSGLAPGPYSGSISINGGAVTVPVSVTVSASTPAPSIAAVVNAATFGSGPVAPGEIVTIEGAGLGPSAALGLQLDASGKVATTLGGVSVSFSGHLAPLIYVSNTQINCVVPYEIARESQRWVQVQYAGLTSTALPLQLAPAAPGIFTQNGSGTGVAAASNTANCPAGAATCGNDSSTPAPQGSVVVIYVTGEGLTNPAGVTGLVTTVDSSPGDPLTPQPQAPLAVSVGGQPAAVAFFGEAPGMVAGVLQINLQIPTGLTSGNLPLVVSLGGAASQAGVTIAVQ